MKTRVLFLDTSNRKMLWKQMLERALKPPEPRKLGWWQVTLAFCDRFWP